MFAGVAGELSCHISSVAVVSGETLVSKAIRIKSSDTLDIVDSVLSDYLFFFSLQDHHTHGSLDKLYYCQCLLHSLGQLIYILCALRLKTNSYFYKRVKKLFCQRLSV